MSQKKEEKKMRITETKCATGNLERRKPASQEDRQAIAISYYYQVPVPKTRHAKEEKET